MHHTNKRHFSFDSEFQPRYLSSNLKSVSPQDHRDERVPAKEVTKGAAAQRSPLLKAVKQRLSLKPEVVNETIAVDSVIKVPQINETQADPIVVDEANSSIHRN